MELSPSTPTLTQDWSCPARNSWSWTIEGPDRAPSHRPSSKGLLTIQTPFLQRAKRQILHHVRAEHWKSQSLRGWGWMGDLYGFLLNGSQVNQTDWQLDEFDASGKGHPFQKETKIPVMNQSGSAQSLSFCSLSSFNFWLVLPSRLAMPNPFLLIPTSHQNRRHVKNGSHRLSIPVGSGATSSAISSTGTPSSILRGSEKSM